VLSEVVAEDVEQLLAVVVDIDRAIRAVEVESSGQGRRHREAPFG